MITASKLLMLFGGSPLPPPIVAHSDLETDFRALLLSMPGIAALLTADRINWGDHPQGLGFPSVVLNTISYAEGLVMNGPNGLAYARVQVDCYSLQYSECKTISNALRLALHGYRDDDFRLVRHASTRDIREGGTNEAERPFGVSMDFLTSWRVKR